MASRAGPAGRVLGDLALADHACASLVAGWARTGGGRWPAWRAAFTGAGRPGGLARDVPGLLGYRHFLAALADLLDVSAEEGRPPGRSWSVSWWPGATSWPGPTPTATCGCCSTMPGPRCCWSTRGPEARRSWPWPSWSGPPAGRRTRSSGWRPWPRTCWPRGRPRPGRWPGSWAGSRSGSARPWSGAWARSSRSPPPGAGCGCSPSRPRPTGGEAFTNLDKAAQAERFDDAVLLPFLVRRAAGLAATRQVPLQFVTGAGDEDVYLPHADPALLWPLLRDPRTEDCPVVLLGCYPYVGGAAHLAGTYPRCTWTCRRPSPWPSRSRPG